MRYTILSLLLIFAIKTFSQKQTDIRVVKGVTYNLPLLHGWRLLSSHESSDVKNNPKNINIGTYLFGEGYQSNFNILGLDKVTEHHYTLTQFNELRTALFEKMKALPTIPFNTIDTVRLKEVMLRLSLQNDSIKNTISSNIRTIPQAKLKTGSTTNTYLSDLGFMNFYDATFTYNEIEKQLISVAAFLLLNNHPVIIAGVIIEEDETLISTRKKDFENFVSTIVQLNPSK